MRKAGKDIPLPGGATIPAGCPVAVAFSSMAEREPAWQADWEAFKPERFLTATGVTSGGGGGGGVVLSQPPAGYNPFGVGVRCAGGQRAGGRLSGLAAVCLA